MDRRLRTKVIDVEKLAALDEIVPDMFEPDEDRITSKRDLRNMLGDERISLEDRDYEF